MRQHHSTSHSLHPIVSLHSTQDEEVDRLERANKPGGYLGLSRPEVMEAMYGRMDPSPAGEWGVRVCVDPCVCLLNGCVCGCGPCALVCAQPVP